jgi:hypothetical protein
VVNELRIIPQAVIILASPVFSPGGQEPSRVTASGSPAGTVSGSFHPANGLPRVTVESVTLAIYPNERGGTPLLQETQNLVFDAEGRYTALLGSTLSEGIPWRFRLWRAALVSGAIQPARREGAGTGRVGERPVCIESGRCRDIGREAGLSVCVGACGEQNPTSRSACRLTASTSGFPIP